MPQFATLLVLLLVGLASTSMAAKAQRSITENFSIILSNPQGYCSLDPSHPVDAAYMSDWQRMWAVGEQLLRAAVECAQLEARRSSPATVVEYSQYLIVSGWKYEGLTYDQRVSVPARMCRTVRKDAGQADGEPRPSLENRLAAALSTLKMGETKVIGAIDEEPAACYVLVATRSQTLTGQPASWVHVGGTATIKGRVLSFYLSAHTSAGKEVAALSRTANILKGTIRAHLAANK